jgi:hypothetical protein
MKLDLLTNATVVGDAIRFVSHISNENEKLKSASGKDDQEESNEPDYGEDEDQLEEEQKEETGETTVNQILSQFAQKAFLQR